MKLLATITDEDVLENVQNKSTQNFYKRQASRAVVFTDSNQVHLLNMSNHGYHKLPGGGIDDGEDKIQALYRELYEEIGCPAEVIKEVGEIKEYRNEMELDQTSYCYIARQSGELTLTRLEPDEVDKGAKPELSKDIDDAIKTLESDNPKTDEGKFIHRRDLIFLYEVKSLIQ